MKYLFISIATVIIFMHFDQASAQDNVLCDTSWWQQLQEEEVTQVNEDINNNNLHGQCNKDGDTPLMRAYKARVSDTTILNLLKVVALNAIKDFITARNVRGESFVTMLLREEYEENALFYVNVDVDMDVQGGEF